MGEVEVRLHIEDYTVAELAALRAKIQSFLDNEPKAQLMEFVYTENCSSQ